MPDTTTRPNEPPMLMSEQPVTGPEPDWVRERFYRLEKQLDGIVMHNLSASRQLDEIKKALKALTEGA